MFYLNQDVKEASEKIAQIGLAQDESKGIDTKWFRHITTLEKKREFAASLRNSTLILDILKSVLVKEYEEKLKNRDVDFTNPSWALQQANKVGYMKAIESFMNLLTIQTK